MLHISQLSEAAQRKAKALKRDCLEHTSGMSDAGVFAKPSGRGWAVIFNGSQPRGEWQQINFSNEY